MPSCADGIQCTEANTPSALLREERLQRPPHPQEPQSSSEKSTAFLRALPFIQPRRGSVSCSHGERTRQVRGFRATVALVPPPAPARAPCPLPGDAPISHGQSSAHSADRCCFPSGLSRSAVANPPNTHVFLCPAVRCRAFSTTPFSEREPHVWPRGETGCPATHPSH